MITIFDTKEQFNTYTNNGQNIPSGFLYYVKEDETVHFNTNNIDGKQEIKNGLTDPEGEGYIIPTGNIAITENGTNIDIAQYETASVAVPQPSGNITLTQNGENIDIEDYATATVNVPIPQGYIQPTGNVSITANANNIDVAQYATASVNVESDYVGNPNFSDTTLSNTNINKCFSKFVIPSSVTTIGNSAFQGCSGLTSITIPNSVTRIGADAFYGCSGLTSVTIPNSVTTIGSSAFQGCSGLTSITIPSSVTSIYDNAFQYCSNLTKIITNDIADWCGKSLASGTLTIAHHLYSDENTEITNLTVPNTVTSIGTAFYQCTGLTSVTIPSSVTSIGNQAFRESGLTSVTFSEGLITIGAYSFLQCTGLSSVTIPNSVTTISDYAFMSIGENFTTLVIGSGITSIGNCVFDGNNKLKNITILATTPPTLGSSVFNTKGMSGRKFYVPAESVETYKAASGWSSFASQIEAIPTT